MSVVIASKLTKRYGELEAVRDISFEVLPGECYGLLGPNGAGKTTTLSMIRCVSPPSGGQLKVFGMEVSRFGRTIRCRLGVVPQMDSLDPDLTVHDNLFVYAGYFGIRGKEARARADQLLAFMSLEKKAGVKIHQLSGGLRRRLLVARGMINSPEMLMLDEPTTGLDPQARRHIWQRLRILAGQGTTMMLSTHYMDEAEALCDRLSIIDQGRIIVTGAPKDLILEHAGEEVLELFDLARSNPSTLQHLLDHSLPEGIRVERHQDSLSCFTPAGTRFPLSFLNEVRKEGFALTVRRASLEDVFLNLTGRELRE
jgi:lipooligosaccharide transport system ATP-binding protein